MPSVNPAPSLGKVATVEMDYVNYPMKPAVVIIEHKIRNLEKRKAKLDQYKSEQDGGKELNADQLAAVAKYGEVMQQLEFARDLIKQIGQVNEETKREIKKQRKAELAERAVAETEKLRNLFLLQSILNELEKFGTIQELTETDLQSLETLLHFQKNHPFLRCTGLNVDHTLDEVLDMLASNWFNMLDGSKKSVDSQSTKDRITFKALRDSLVAIANSEYFVNKRRKVPVAVEEELVREEAANISDSESIPSSATNQIPPSSTNETVTAAPTSTAACPIQESAYSFLQDSQIDLESPHFDPAVVAVSSCVPGPTNQQQMAIHNQRSAFTVSTTAPQPLTANNMSSAADGDYGRKNETSMYGKRNEGSSYEQKNMYGMHHHPPREPVPLMSEDLMFSSKPVPLIENDKNDWKTGLLIDEQRNPIIKSHLEFDENGDNDYYNPDMVWSPEDANVQKNTSKPPLPEIIHTNETWKYNYPLYPLMTPAPSAPVPLGNYPLRPVTLMEIDTWVNPEEEGFVPSFDPLPSPERSPPRAFPTLTFFRRPKGQEHPMEGRGRGGRFRGGQRGGASSSNGYWNTRGNNSNGSSMRGNRSSGTGVSGGGGFSNGRMGYFRSGEQNDSNFQSSRGGGGRGDHRPQFRGGRGGSRGSRGGGSSQTSHGNNYNNSNGDFRRGGGAAPSRPRENNGVEAKSY